MALGWMLLGAVAGSLGTLALVRKGTIDPYAANPAWGNFIRGEYWIDQYGEAQYADLDVGEKGHEAIALDLMLDKEALVDGLIEYYESPQALEDGWQQEEIPEKVSELAWLRDSDDVDPSHVYAQEQNVISDEVGAAATDGGKRVWDVLKNDARLAYAQHTGAIAVVDRNFYAWRVTKDTIENILYFLQEQLGGEDEFIAARNEMIWIEEGSKGRTTGVTLGKLMDLETPGELWSQKHEPGLSEWLQTHDPSDVRRAQ
jgi:hypothetical protein